MSEFDRRLTKLENWPGAGMPRGITAWYPTLGEPRPAPDPDKIFLTVVYADDEIKSFDHIGVGEILQEGLHNAITKTT